MIPRVFREGRIRILEGCKSGTGPTRTALRRTGGRCIVYIATHTSERVARDGNVGVENIRGMRLLGAGKKKRGKKRRCNRWADERETHNSFAKKERDVESKKKVRAGRDRAKADMSGGLNSKKC